MTDPVSPSSAPTVKHTKSFKKYTDEAEPQVLDYVRSWARGEKLISVHEDKSLVKITGTEAQITALLLTLKERFGYIPPEEREGAKKGSAAE